MFGAVFSRQGDVMFRSKQPQPYACLCRPGLRPGLGLDLSVSDAQGRDEDRWMQPWYYGWGFNLPRGQALLDKWNQIPENTDILVTHCPPLGYGMMTDGTTTFVNASACTVNFQPMNPPIVFDLPNPRSS
ncbi:hypothetical protein WMY93_020748 [Mugilogobius chulae]|uniref:Uncharacterized protein n=1 Tax=Mugilogobius chulae TaxID=88201 RepID=A0AAW0NFU6_9GOBI